MKNNVKLQAHRGVSSSFPENSMASFRAAIHQGYDYIELDPSCTLDGRIVVLHDGTLNRTARKDDGSKLRKEIKISDISYEDALEYDIGIAHSVKFKGERIPLLSEVLALARENRVKVKLDNKVESFGEEAREELYKIIDAFEETVAITSGKEAMIAFYAERFPRAELHYDGTVDEALLKRLSVYGDRLTVWLPYRSELTSWVKCPFADEGLCSLVKKYARLGIWILNDYESFYEAVSDFLPDIVETTGTIKPDSASDFLCDTHIHSENSHDSESRVDDIAESAIEKGISVITVTDHCDIQYYYRSDVRGGIASSVRQATEAAEKYRGRLKVLRGVELGEGIWFDNCTAEIVNDHDYDMIIGSVHAIRNPKYSMPYSTIDFSEFTDGEIDDYLNEYFDDVLEMLHKIPCDTMAHLTCPLRYINGKYKRNVDIEKYEGKIIPILNYIIKHSIAMEINTHDDVFMPSEGIIRKFRELGGYLVTLGSDSHTPDSLGKDFEKAIGILRELGFEHYYYYEKRVNIPVSIKEKKI